MCGGGGDGVGCVFVCVHAFVRAGDSVSARVLCLSVCQFDFVSLSMCSNLLLY